MTNMSELAELKLISYTRYMPKGLKGFQKGHKINLGKKYSAERRKNISNSLKGRVVSDEWRKNLSLSHTGNRHTEESKKKISEGMKGKSTKWLIGRKLSDYQRSQLLQAAIGREVSLETRQKISSAQKGEKGNNWKGGLTPLNQLARSSGEYKAWRNAVYRRDNYTCQECYVRGGVLHAHHVQNFADNMDLRYEVSNGITMCRDCHRKTDTWGPRNGPR